MSGAQLNNGHTSQGLKRMVSPMLIIALAAGLVVFGARLAPGPGSQSLSTTPNQSQAGVVSVTPVSASATSASLVGTPGSSTVVSPTATATEVASSLPPLPATPTSTPVPVVFKSGASSEALNAIQQFVAANRTIINLGAPASQPFTDVQNGVVGQYFSNAVLEYHPELKGTPYAVELSRVGAAAAVLDGLSGNDAFHPLPATTGSNADCRFFVTTGHRLCGGFRVYWQSHGLDMGDRGVSFRESLALLGYPISEEFVDPKTGHTVQYFERARLEFDPSQPVGHRVTSNLAIESILTRWNQQIINGVDALTGGG